MAAARKVVMKDGAASLGDEVKPLFEARTSLGGGLYLPRGAEPRVAAVKLEEVRQQRAPLVVRRFWLFEHVPQRRVEIVDVALIKQALRHSEHLRQSHPKALGREPHSHLEVGATARPNSRNDLPQKSRAVLE